FLRTVELQFRKDISNFSPQNISNMMWAFGRMGHRGKYTTMLAMQKSMLQRSDEFYQPRNVQAVTNITWSVAAVGHQPRLKYLELLEERLPPLMPVMNEQELVNTIWAMSDFRYVPAAPFLRSMEAALIATLQGGRVEPRHRAQHLANSLSAFQKLGCRPTDELMAVMDRAILNLEMHHFTEQAKTNLIWSMTMMDRTDLASYRPLWIALEQSMSKEMRIESLGQVYQAAMMLEHVHKSCDVDCWELVPALVRRAVDARKERIKAIKDGRHTPVAPTMSRFHKEVSLVLSMLRLRHSNEFITEEGVFVDIKVENQDGRMVAIEVDGRPHFSVNGGQPLGSTITRDRLLKACGWELIVVPLDEWTVLSTFQDKVRYMTTKLGDLVLPHQKTSDLAPQGESLLQMYGYVACDIFSILAVEICVAIRLFLSA
ncbi:hypothetical protein CYMTET_31257, partial [Cymbomonas tetramitiformis]